MISSDSASSRSMNKYSAEKIETSPTNKELAKFINPSIFIYRVLIFEIAPGRGEELTNALVTKISIVFIEIE